MYYKKELINEGYTVNIRYLGDYESDFKKKTLDPVAVSITVKSRSSEYPNILTVLETEDTRQNLVIDPNTVKLLDVDETESHIQKLKAASDMVLKIKECLLKDFPGILH